MIDLCFGARAGRIARADQSQRSKDATVYIGEPDMSPRQQLPRRVPSRESETIVLFRVQLELGVLMAFCRGLLQSARPGPDHYAELKKTLRRQRHPAFVLAVDVALIQRKP